MENFIVEVGMKLDKSFDFYKDMLLKHGLKQVFYCETFDVYYSNKKSFDGLTEKQIKNSCIRIRNSQDKEKENSLINEGYFKVLETLKKDYHYKNENMKSCIQLQIINNLGLVVYYDNPEYYNLPLDVQRSLLFKELNNFGFTFKENDLGIDKLRTLLYKKEMFSKNQNG